MIVTENSVPKTVEVYKKGDSAYLQAVEGGYTGTLAQFEAGLILSAEYADNAEASAIASAASAGTASTQAGIATTKAGEALSSKNSADADVILTHADVVLTHADVQTVASDKATVSGYKDTALGYKNAADADVILTHADVVLTHADVVLTHADQATVAADKATTSGYKDIATSQAGTATTQAGIATTQAGTATTKAAEAVVSAAAAAASAASAALYAQAIAKGNWNAATNTPTLANGTGTVGWWYYVSTPGTSLSQTFIEGDVIFYNGSTWVRIPKVFAIPNNSWWQSYDYSGNLVNTWRYNSDNEFEWAAPIKIAALRHVLNQGLVEICNIPISALSTVGTEHGFKFTIGSVEICKIAALSDGSVSVTSPTVTIPIVKAKNYNRTVQVLTYAGTTNMDYLLGSFASLTLTGNVTIAMSNIADGGKGEIAVIQDNSGSRLLTAITHAGLTVKYKGGDSTLTTTGNKTDIIMYKRIGAFLYIDLNKNY